MGHCNLHDGFSLIPPLQHNSNKIIYTVYMYYDAGNIYNEKNI